MSRLAGPLMFWRKLHSGVHCTAQPDNTLGHLSRLRANIRDTRPLGVTLSAAECAVPHCGRHASSESCTAAGWGLVVGAVGHWMETDPNVGQRLSSASCRSPVEAVWTLGPNVFRGVGWPPGVMPSAAGRGMRQCGAVGRPGESWSPRCTTEAPMVSRKMAVARLLQSLAESTMRARRLAW